MERVYSTIHSSPRSLPLVVSLSIHSSSKYLELAHTFLGGKLSLLIDAKGVTVVTAIANKYSDHFTIA